MFGLSIPFWPFGLLTLSVACILRKLFAQLDLHLNIQRLIM